MRALVYAGVLSALAQPARAEIYECVKSGNKRFNNIAAEAKGCKEVDIGPIETALRRKRRPPSKPGHKPGVSYPGDFPEGGWLARRRLATRTAGESCWTDEVP